MDGGTVKYMKCRYMTVCVIFSLGNENENEEKKQNTHHVYGAK